MNLTLEIIAPNSAQMGTGTRKVFGSAGGVTPCAEGHATFKLHRLGPDSDQWTIDDVRYHK